MEEDEKSRPINEKELEELSKAMHELEMVSGDRFETTAEEEAVEPEIAEDYFVNAMYTELVGDEEIKESSDDEEEVIVEEKEVEMSDREVVRRIERCIEALERRGAGPEGVDGLAKLVDNLSEQKEYEERAMVARARQTSMHEFFS